MVAVCVSDVQLCSRSRSEESRLEIAHRNVKMKNARAFSNAVFCRLIDTLRSFRSLQGLVFVFVFFSYTSFFQFVIGKTCCIIDAQTQADEREYSMTHICYNFLCASYREIFHKKGAYVGKLSEIAECQWNVNWTQYSPLENNILDFPPRTCVPLDCPVNVLASPGI